MLRTKFVTGFASDWIAALANISSRQDSALLLLDAPVFCSDLGFYACFVFRGM